MIVSILAVSAGACAIAIVASILIARASNRPPVWNMMFGALCGFAVLAAALLIALLLTRAAFRN